MKRVLTAAAVAASMVASMAAHAAPYTLYDIYDGATLIGSGQNAPGDTGVGLISGSDARFSVSGNFATDPFLTAPDFSSNVFAIQSRAANTSGTLTIRLTGLDRQGYAGGSAMTTFTLNSLLGGPFTSGTISVYYDNGNTAYGTDTQIATDTFTGLQQFSSSYVSSITPSARFSETIIYKLSYGSGGAGTVTASTQLAGIADPTFATVVPEPASWTLMLVGIGAAGATLRQRRKARMVQPA